MENTKKKTEEMEAVNEAKAEDVKATALAQETEGEFVSVTDLVHSGLYLDREAYQGKKAGTKFYNYFVKFSMLGKIKHCTFVTAKKSIGKDDKGDKIFIREADGYQMLDDMFNFGAVELCFELKNRINFVGEKELNITPYAYIFDKDNLVEVSYPLKTDTNADASILKTIVGVLKHKGVIE